MTDFEGVSHIENIDTGLAAAVAAVENGSQVIVLEKRRTA